jgi:two-component system chemotaxis sensor kinase CheA
MNMLRNLVESFLLESEDLLTQIEDAALALDAGEGTADTVNQLFRAFHTIKGSGGMCGLLGIASFTHHVENLLAKVREGSVPVTPTLIELVLKSRDHLKILLSAEQGGAAPTPGSAEKLIAAVEACGTSAGSAETASGAPSDPDGGDSDRAAGMENTWAIHFRPSPLLLACGGNPISLFRELAELGRCQVMAHTENVPALDAIQPEQCYLWWTISLSGACSENAIRDVFIFVESDGQLEIQLIASVPGEHKEAVISFAKTPDAVDESAAISGATVTQKAAAPQAAAQKDGARDSSVRVPSSRLDRLVNLVGELVINQSRLAQAASQSGAPEFTNPVQELERLLSELRDNVLGIRMLPIGTLFGRFRRLVHDLSTELGKEIDLVTEGAETELDKSILDQLSEPLVHCLRNSLDHGVEAPAERLAKGKPRRATIRLSAVHTGSDVVVSIHDDGRGIDRAAVQAKAVEKHLIAPDAVLNEKDVFNLILMPGFSTARQVTNVSGRGVGMDAVKRQIDMLRGSLSLASEAGKGTRVMITLPLTLAIIDGLQVQVGSDQFIVPMAAVTENVELLRSERASKNGRNVIAVRGELIPYIDLRQAFGIHSDAPAIAKVVIAQHEDQRVGLVVDCVLGTHQTVIQSLGKVFRNVNVVSGATIMGDGRVALILDVAAIVRHADRECRSERTSPLNSAQVFQKKQFGIEGIGQDLVPTH